MDLILTMAGKYKRFREEGYRIPKYLLPWGKRSILGTILMQMNKNNTFDNIYLVANKKDEDYATHIENIIDGEDIPLQNLFFIDDTETQTETAHVSLKKIQTTDHIAFHNIDTILYNRNFSSVDQLLNKCDGVIDVFKSSNHKYSYVLTKNNVVTLIKEKMVISDKATSGFYAFSSPHIFQKYYKDQEYISDLYLDMILDECTIRTTDLHSEKDTIVLGTPEEYMSNSHILDLEE